MILVLPFDKLRASFQNPAKTTFYLTFYPMLKHGATDNQLNKAAE